MLYVSGSLDIASELNDKIERGESVVCDVDGKPAGGGNYCIYNPKSGTGYKYLVAYPERERKIARIERVQGLELPEDEEQKWHKARQEWAENTVVIVNPPHNYRGRGAWKARIEKVTAG